MSILLFAVLSLLIFCICIIYVTIDIASVTMEKTVAAPRVAMFTSLSQTNPKSAIIVAERQVICPIPVTTNFLTDLITGLLGTYYIFHVQYPKRFYNILNLLQEKV